MLLVTITILVTIFYFSWKSFSYRRRQDRVLQGIPGPPTKPLIGHLLLVVFQDAGI